MKQWLDGTNSLFLFWFITSFSDGVRNLDCFKRNTSHYICDWKPGDHASEKTYTLVIQQWVMAEHLLCWVWRSALSCTCEIIHMFKISSPFRGRKKTTVYCNITDFFHSKVSLFQKFNVSAEVYENPESANCTKAVFSGSPMSLRKFRAGFLWPFPLAAESLDVVNHLPVTERCDPPHKAAFSRQSGSLAVNVTWPQWVQKYIKHFSVRYKALGSQWWSEVGIKY